MNYIEFLRDVGVHFSVNKMLTAECVKSRLERGLTFLEFNYMLMQSYDFLHVNRELAVSWSWAATTSGATFWAALILFDACRSSRSMA